MTLALRPTLPPALDLDHAWGKRKIRQRDIEQLRQLGLVEEKGATATLQLTKAGREVFEGGRDPEGVWARAWDGR